MPRILLVVATPLEAEALLSGMPGRAGVTPPPWTPAPVGPGLELIVTGIGKANAAGAVGAALARHESGGGVDGVVSIGIGGTLPVAGGSVRVPGTAVLAAPSVFADEGVETSGGWLDAASIGFPVLAGVQVGEGIWPGAELRAWLRPMVDGVGPIATVSTCSGTDERASAIASRTGAAVEAMEGAAVGLACVRMGGIRFAEVRVVSNRTGERSRQGWDMDRACARLRAIGMMIAR